MKSFYKINILLIIFLSLPSNAFLSLINPSFDGKYKIDLSETISMNKDYYGINIVQKEFFGKIKNSLKEELIFEGDVVTIYDDGELTSACVFNEKKFELGCENETYLITTKTKKRKILYLLPYSNIYFIAIKRQ